MGKRLRFFSAFFLFLSCSSVLLGKTSNQNTCKKSKLEINLSSGFATPSVDYTWPSISQKGDQVYLYYINYGDAIGTQPAAQLFNNVNGQLVLAHTLPMDSIFTEIFMGKASNNFTRFSDMQADEFATMRVRVLDQNLNVVGSRIFTDPNYFDISGGSFSEDNHYLLFSYNYPAPAPSLGYNSYVYILDATQPGLPTVASIQLPGYGNDFAGPTLFTLTDAKGKKHLYFTFVLQQINFNTQAGIAPYFTQVYEVKDGVISLIDQAPLPKYTENTFFMMRSNGREGFICHGCLCSNDPTQPTIYTVLDPSIVCELPGDCGGIRAYRFDGKTLNLVFTQISNCCSFLLAYPPGDGCSYFLAQAIDIFETPGDPTTQGSNPLEFWSLYDLEEGPNGLVLIPKVGPFQDIKGAYTAFSQDGKWMLRSGGYGYFNGDPNVDSNGIKNVLLFKVSSAPYSPVCSK